MRNTVTFSLIVRAELSEEEQTNVAKYGLGETILYTRGEMADKGSGLLGLASRVAFNVMNISVSVNDLWNGKQVQCKNIMEMLAVEAQIKEAAVTFKLVLDAASHFGGEEVIEL